MLISIFETKTIMILVQKNIIIIIKSLGKLLLLLLYRYINAKILIFIILN
jgi:hypothetical protein